MAIIRQQSWQPEQRVDVPHLRSVESAIANDWDQLVGKALTGRKPLVLRGFTIPVTNTVGNPAPNLILNVASGLVISYNFSESGSLFSVPDNQASEQLINTNVNVTGSFSANTINYIGLDILRNADSSTQDTVQFLDVTTDSEVAEIVPLARTLQYKIIISTQAFSSSTNVVPISKVLTDANNNVVSITDNRNMMFRLGSGGDAANALNTYAWGSRTENNIVYTGGLDPFSGEDKSINNLTDWLDSIMTSVWEIRGGEHWYSPVNWGNVKLAYGQPVLVSSGDNFDFNSGTGVLQWRSLSLIYENAVSGTTFNTITDSSAIGGGTGLVVNDGQCLYVDLARESAATVVPAVASLATLGTSVIPGRRIIIAWRKGSLIYVRDKAYEVGRTFQVATTTTLGIVKLSAASATPAAPFAISDGGGTIVSANGAGSAGANALTITAGNGDAGGFAGGYGLSVTGGNGTAGSAAGAGGIFVGGSSVNGASGSGLVATGGAVTGAGALGYGILVTGGNPGGVGALIRGNSPTSGVTPGMGAQIQGGNAFAGSGENGGIGALITGGAKDGAGTLAVAALEVAGNGGGPNITGSPAGTGILSEGASGVACVGGIFTGGNASGSNGLWARSRRTFAWSSLPSAFSAGGAGVVGVGDTVGVAGTGSFGAIPGGYFQCFTLYTPGGGSLPYTAVTLNQGPLTFTWPAGSLPAVGDGLSSRNVTPKNVFHAWATITLAAAGVATVNDGYNINTGATSWAGGGGGGPALLTVTFSNAFTGNTNYSVIATTALSNSANAIQFVWVATKNAGSIVVQFKDSSWNNSVIGGGQIVDIMCVGSAA